MKRFHEARWARRFGSLLVALALCAWVNPGAIKAAPASGPAPAQAKTPSPQPDGDTELGAALLELRRGVAELELEDSPKPYVSELRTVRAETLTIRGSYGGIIHDLRERQAFGSVAVWVGSRDRDNSSFFGGLQQPGFPIPIDPSARGTRQALWLAMDQGFRAATRVHAAKEAAFARSAEENPPRDRAAPPPAVVRVEWNRDPRSLADPEIAGARFDREAYKTLVSSLSKRFAEHPSIDDGQVILQIFRTYDAVVSTEEVVLGSHSDRAVLAVVAQTQAPDGMELDHGAVLHFSEVPSVDEAMRLEGEAMVDRVLTELETMVAAPMMDEDYDGPILFSGEASAQLLASTLAVHVSGSPAPMSEYGRITELEPHWLDRLGRDVMPSFLHVTDDPTAEGFGHYELDAQGYRPESLALVRGGRLSRLLMTRTPNATIETSNGRARSTANLMVGPSISNLSVRSDRRGLSEASMHSALLARAAEDGYEFAYVIESLRNGNVLGVVPRDSAAIYGTGRKVSLPLPSRIYKIERDKSVRGKRPVYRKTLVRGALLAPASMRVLRRIREVGDRRATVQMRLPPGISGGYNADLGIDAMLSQTVDVQVETPPLLIEGMEIMVERGEHERLPILEHPLRRTATGE
jgi:hypothetical protein